MATADDLRAKLANLNQSIARERHGFEQLDTDIGEAKTRQKLRRQVELAESELRILQCVSQDKKIQRCLIDNDAIGDVGNRSGAPDDDAPKQTDVPKEARLTTDVSSIVEHGELTWEIKGFSWLKSSLKQESGDPFTRSSAISVVGHEFSLLYHPEQGEVDDSEEQRASLAIYHVETDDTTSLAFRYKIFIKSSKRGFVQWGPDGDVCLIGRTDGMVFGPDVCDSDARVPSGIFNLNHEELLSSEWVADDTLTAKVQVAVRPSSNLWLRSRPETEIQLLPATITENLLSLLDAESSGDVSFIVQGEVIISHSSILCARSEVFNRMLNCGMRESSSKEIVIDDCDPKLFRAMIRFMYSDNFDHLDKEIVDERGRGSSECHVEGKAEEQSTQPQPLLKLLALSHKYQLARLQSWCERELCACISVEGVCSVLCRAHLYEATQLEQVCLKFIKANMNKISKTPSFGVVGRDWPEVMMKMSICSAGVSDQEMLEALAVQQKPSAKRKREE